MLEGIAMYHVIRKMYRCVPKGIRSWITRRSVLASMKERGKRWLATITPANNIYDASFYKQREGWGLEKSAKVIAESLARLLHPATVLDAGCGSGELLDAFRSQRISGFGLEVSNAAVEICRKKGLDVILFDLANDSLAPEVRWDLVVSFEVAEHLPETAAGQYVRTLTQAAPVCVMSAARPGQGGEGHINEQPPEYWIEKFKKCGWYYDEETTQVLRKMWKHAGVKPWYWENVLCFKASL